MSEAPKKGFGDEEEAEGDGGGAHKSALWMISYIDLLSLLLAFFVLLFTLSNVDKNKFKSITQSLEDSVKQTQDAAAADNFKKKI